MGKTIRGILQVILVIEFCAYSAMRANVRAVSALDTRVIVPFRNEVGNISFFPLRSTTGESTVKGHLTNREIITMTKHHGRRHILYKTGRFRRYPVQHFDFTGEL